MFLYRTVFSARVSWYMVMLIVATKQFFVELLLVMVTLQKLIRYNMSNDYN